MRQRRMVIGLFAFAVRIAIIYGTGNRLQSTAKAEALPHSVACPLLPVPYYRAAQRSHSALARASSGAAPARVRVDRS